MPSPYLQCVPILKHLPEETTGKRDGAQGAIELQRIRCDVTSSRHPSQAVDGAGFAWGPLGAAITWTEKAVRRTTPNELLLACENKDLSGVALVACRSCPRCD